MLPRGAQQWHPAGKHSRAVDAAARFAAVAPWRMPQPRGTFARRGEGAEP
ncbi:conserved hypothetical protein [Ricinus communis]|uniref:Uncharacterized protein n=1 Tax=Ricinus communis TaxID=3988 RepID=B9TLM0_RICCO|nr:conserved hypothetical protein [Ricinus communis]